MKDISKQPRKRKAESTALSNLRNTLTLLAIVPTAPRQGVSCPEKDVQSFSYSLRLARGQGEFSVIN
jgi:hypothetical protein